MCQRKCPATQRSVFVELGYVQLFWFHLQTAFHVVQLAHLEIHTLRSAIPKKNARRTLHHALAHHDPLSTVDVW